jgi:hypothetical protein
MYNTSKPTFVFNGEYDDLDQVAAYYPAYLVKRQELDAQDAYPYNARFEGIWPEIDGKQERTLIYLCQHLHSKIEDSGKVARALQDGYTVVELDGDDLLDVKVSDAVLAFEYGHSGYQSFGPGRFIRTPGNWPYFIPRGKRTRGRTLIGNKGEAFVLIKTA